MTRLQRAIFAGLVAFALLTIVQAINYNGPPLKEEVCQ